MIDALHLIWIIPCSMLVGFMTAALLTANSTYPEDRREWKEE